MQQFLPGMEPNKWTVKRLYVQIITQLNIPIKKGENTKKMGATIDFYLANGGISNVDANPKARWSAKLDMARLIIVMFGTEDARRRYIESRQLATRERLDNTKLRSIKCEYWVDIAEKYNDPQTQTIIDVDNDIVNMYLRSELKSNFRVAWVPVKLREMFRELRADYEGSEEVRRYGESGQNGPFFYPDFQKKNAAHVLFHYLHAGMPRGSVLGDLPKRAITDSNVVDLSNVDHNDDNEYHTPIVTRRRRKRSRSPALSIGSTNSSTSALHEATKSFEYALKTMLGTFQKKMQTSNSVPTKNVVDKTDHVLGLVKCKRKLIETIDTLEREGDADLDDIKVLKLQLLDVKQELQSYLKD